MRSTRSILLLLGTLALAAVGGLAGTALRVPAGGIIGSVVLVGAVGVTTRRLPQVPVQMRKAAQVLMGTVIGSGVGPHLLASLSEIWVAALLLVVWIIGLGLLLGWWISRITELDLTTALFSFAPGGLSEMVLAAEDLGADGRLVGIVGLLRILGSILAVPLAVGYVVLRQ